MAEYWQHKQIEIPAGVEMRNTKTGITKTYPTPLLCKAKRLMDGSTPQDDIWLFSWLSKPYSVQQSLVRML